MFVFNVARCLALFFGWQGRGFQLLRGLALFRSRGVHDADDADLRQVLEGARDVSRVEGARGRVPADHVHAGHRGAEALHGEGQDNENVR